MTIHEQNFRGSALRYELVYIKQLCIHIHTNEYIYTNVCTQTFDAGVQISKADCKLAE